MSDLCEKCHRYIEGNVDRKKELICYRCLTVSAKKVEDKTPEIIIQPKRRLRLNKTKLTLATA